MMFYLKAMVQYKDSNWGDESIYVVLDLAEKTSLTDQENKKNIF